MSLFVQRCQSCDEIPLVEQDVSAHCQTLMYSHEDTDTPVSSTPHVGNSTSTLSCGPMTGVQRFDKQKLIQLIEDRDTEENIHEIMNLVGTGADTDLLFPDPVQYYIDNRKNSFLHVAVSRNKVSILRRFLSHRLSYLYNTQNADGDIPLNEAIRHNHAEAVRCLTEALHRQGTGFDESRVMISKKNSKSRTALHLAVLHHRDGKIVKLIVEAMTSVFLIDQTNATDAYDWTALHYAIQLCSERKCHCDCLQQLSLLNPGSVTNGNKVIALHLAAKLRDRRILDSVLKTFYYKGTKHDIDALNAEDRTALMICAANGDVDGFKLLLSTGATVGILNNKKQNVLHLMVQKTVKEPDTVESILDIFKMIESLLATSHTRDVYSRPFDIDQTTTTLTTRPTKNCDLCKLHCPLDEHSADLLHLLTHDYAAYDKESSEPDSLQYNVLQLAAYINATDIFRQILKITNREREAKQWKLKYIIPPQLLSMDVLQSSDALKESSSRHAPDRRGSFKRKCDKSCIELIMLNCDEEDVETFYKMAKINPIKGLVTKLSYGRIVVGSLMVVLHIIYMSLFSMYSLRTVTYWYNSTSTSAERNDVYRNPTPYWYCLFLIYPVLKVIITFASIELSCDHICQLVRTRHKPSEYETNFMVFDVVTIITSLLFSVVIIVWYILYLLSILQRDIDFETYAKTVSSALLIGWLYTVELMRALPKFQAFTKSLKLIIVKDVMRIVCVYLMVLTGFALAIHVCILFVSSNADSVIDTFFETMGTTFGLSDLFGNGSQNKQFDFLSYSSAGSLSGFFRGLLAIYMLMTYIILINLLISMLNKSYNTA